MENPSSHEQRPLAYFDLPQVLPGRFHMPTRMTVLPLGPGRLALVSPIPLDDTRAAEIAKLGEVAYLIAPNLLHHLYLGEATRRYPQAKVLAPRGLRKKRPDLRIDRTFEEALPEELASHLEVVRVGGAAVVDEHVILHRALRTLVVTDLVFNLRRPVGIVAHIVLFLAGCYRKLAQSRAWRVFVKDKAAASASVERILALDFDALVVAHGDIIPTHAHPQLEKALRWMRRR
jgi:hypothetical protein